MDTSITDFSRIASPKMKVYDFLLHFIRLIFPILRIVKKISRHL